MATITLHAAHPTSLADPTLAQLLRACAEETAEHHGIEPPAVAVFDDHIELRADVPQPVLLAIAAELRRTTGRWHRAKYGAPLWRGE